MFNHDRLPVLLLPVLLATSAAWSLSAHAAPPPLAVQPGTRAMGMAGVFIAQADDSSGIWYNPAGPRHDRVLQQDVSLDWGATTLPALSTDGGSDAGFQDNTTTLRYAGIYRGSTLGEGQEDEGASGVGLAYLRPYRGMAYVDAARSLVDSTPFGRVEVEYHQVSGALSHTPFAGLTLGGTLDFVWTDAACLDVSPCVDDGPTGAGASVGVLYDAWRAASHVVTLAALWRSRANLGYDTTPSSGLGTVLESYVADRPETGGLGATVRIPASFALISANVMFERQRWAAASGSAAPLEDVTTSGAGIEALRPLAESQTLALRLGARRDAGASDTTALAAGVGFGLDNKHMVDAAVQRVSADNGEGEDTWLWSLSYSIQK